jgi:mannose-1-phosphate guanylyltransferase
MISDNGKRQRFFPGVPSYDPRQWGVILAGGDGVRLRSLTRRITGDDRPKQFCPILDDESLLDRTRRRVARTVAPERTVAVLTKAHERFYAPLVRQVPSRLLVVQPENRGTSPAILYSLLRIAKMAPTASVALFPSDHYVSDDEAFMAHVRLAFDAVLRTPELVILLGISPASPETAYGWIEPDRPIFGNGRPAVFRVRRFWEKPKPALARALLAGGCLWNSFVIVARGATLLALVQSAAPDLYHIFLDLWPALNTDDEKAAVEALYAGLPSTNFSEQVLASRPEDLAVLPVGSVQWSDLGEPGRVLSVLAQSGVHRAMAPTPISA